MKNTAFPGVRGALRPLSTTPVRVEIRRGVREELLILINGRIASLADPETVNKNEKRFPC